MIFERISDDIPPQIGVLQAAQAKGGPTKFDVINDIILFLTVYCRILQSFFYISQSDVRLQNQVH